MISREILEEIVRLLPSKETLLEVTPVSVLHKRKIPLTITVELALKIHEVCSQKKAVHY